MSKLIKYERTVPSRVLTEHITRREAKEQLVVEMIKRYVDDISDDELDNVFNISETESFNGVTFKCEFLIKTDEL